MSAGWHLTNKNEGAREQNERCSGLNGWLGHSFSSVRINMVIIDSRSLVFRDQIRKNDKNEHKMTLIVKITLLKMINTKNVKLSTGLKPDIG
ncbi:MAG: hypothetical protein AAF465_04150 [Pseudomonadota bacterium]